jgi:uncharacterized protein YnzC (UPF0291/DUF896 family)
MSNSNKMASTTCVIPQNQPIYQALLDKAASYSADKPYQTKAYQKAAESIAALNRSIYDDLILEKWESWIPGIGPSIEKFVNDFIAANPQPPQYNAEEAMNEACKIAAQNAPTPVPTPVPTPSPILEAIMAKPVGEYLTVNEIVQVIKDHNNKFKALLDSTPIISQMLLGCWEESMKGGQGCLAAKPKPAEEQQQARRSARLAAKPSKSYKQEDPYDSEDIPDDAEVDDERDEDYVPQKDEESDEEEESELMMLFRKRTKKYNLTDDELKEVVRLFEAYYEANKDNNDDQCIWDKVYDWKTNTYTNNKMRSMKDIVFWYVIYNKDYVWGSLDAPFRNLHNPILNKANFNKVFRNILIKEVGKMGLEYDERLMDGFFNWYMDPAKKEQTHHKCADLMLWYRHTKNESVRRYIKSIPKKFIF